MRTITLNEKQQREVEILTRLQAGALEGLAQASLLHPIPSTTGNPNPSWSLTNTLPSASAYSAGLSASSTQPVKCTRSPIHSRSTAGR